jgi:hypothetical protein
MCPVRTVTHVSVQAYESEYLIFPVNYAIGGNKVGHRPVVPFNLEYIARDADFVDGGLQVSGDAISQSKELF